MTDEIVSKRPLTETDRCALEVCEQVARDLGWSEEMNQLFWFYLRDVFNYHIHLAFPFTSLLLKTKEGDHSAQNIRRVLKKSLHAYERIMVDTLSSCCLSPDIIISGTIGKEGGQIKCLHCGACVRGNLNIRKEWKKKYFKPLE